MHIDLKTAMLRHDYCQPDTIEILTTPECGLLSGDSHTYITLLQKHRCTQSCWLRNLGHSSCTLHILMRFQNSSEKAPVLQVRKAA
jgi:hypothetical protein